MKCYQGGKIASQHSNLKSGDVLVDDSGVIKAVGKVELSKDTEIIDCTGKILVPGMFDMHVHSRDPGQTNREDLESCGHAALAGGVTGIALAPDTSPVVDTANLIRSIQKTAAEKCPIDVVQMGAITRGLEGVELASIGAMAKAGSPMLTDSCSSIENPVVFKRAMEYAIEFDIPLASTGDTKSFSSGGVMNEGATSYRLGLPGKPKIAEEIGIARDIKIAEYTGGKLHIQQISTAGSVELIRRAKEDGIDVTCEVSPHHLILTEEAVGEYNTYFKVSPPLRTDSDCEALLTGLKDGVIDVIASNHSPLTLYEKRTDFGSAPFGVTGLETAVLAIYDRFISIGLLDWQTLIKTYSINPRKILNLPTVTIQKDEPANFFIFDPEVTSKISVTNMKSKSPNSPFLDQTLKGKIFSTHVG